MNIVIMGGGKVGESLARRILEGRRHEARSIESDRARSLQLANALDVEIICGDGTNIDMLENAGVRDADCLLRYPVTMRIISLRRSLQSSISARKK